MQQQGPRTLSSMSLKTRTFDLAGICHATNTKSFNVTGVVKILCINAILFLWCTGQLNIISTM